MDPQTDTCSLMPTLTQLLQGATVAPRGEVGVSELSAARYWTKLDLGNLEEEKKR